MWLLQRIAIDANYKSRYILSGFKSQTSSIGTKVKILNVEKSDVNQKHENASIELIQADVHSQAMEINLKNITISSDFPLKSDETRKKVMPFNEMPGPLTLKYISSFWHYIPNAGTQLTRSFINYILSTGPYFKFSNKLKFLSFLFDEYGSIVRIAGPFGGDIVLLNRPDHMQSVFNQEGQYPIRFSFDSLDHYRLKHKKHDLPGLYSIKGEDWLNQRNKIKRSFYSLTNVGEKVETSCNEMVALVSNIRSHQHEVPADFQQKLFKWSLECMGHVLFSERLGLLEYYESAQGDALWIEEALSKASTALMSCEGGLQMWKLVDTPSWKVLVENCSALDSIIGQYIRQTEAELNNEKRKSIIDVTPVESNAVEQVKEMKLENPKLIKSLLDQEGMRYDDILTCVMDMLIIGVNSSTSAMSFILYHLSRAQRSQKILYAELKAAFPDKNHIKVGQLKKLPYLDACIKESLRLVPPVPVISRVLPSSVIIDGYKVPEGSHIVMATQVSGLKEENFDDAAKFHPDRWLTPDVADFHPLSTLPFGHGPRKCIGRGLSEMMLLMLTAKIVRHFKIEYNYGDIQPVTRVFSMASRPLRFRFITRE